MVDRKGFDSRAAEFFLQLAMFAQKNRQVRPEFDDSFDIRVIESAEFRKAVRLGRIFAVIGDPDDPIAQSQGEESFGHARHDRNDPRRRRLFGGFGRRPPPAASRRREEKEENNPRDEEVKPVPSGKAFHFSKSRHERLGWIPWLF